MIPIKTYVISESNNQPMTFNQKFIENNKEKLSIFCYNDSVIYQPLVKNINQHITKINQINNEDFNWKYYIAKYNDLNKINDLNSAIEHWLRHGIKEQRNPIDRKTIMTQSDVKSTISIIGIILDAKKNQHRKIFLINPISNKTFQQANFQKVIDNYMEIIEKKTLSIFSCMQINYAYIIDEKIYDLLLCELSYQINKFDDILEIYISNNANSCQIFNHSNISSNNDNAIFDISKLEKLSQTGEQIYQEIISFRSQYLKNIYEKFIKKYQLQQKQILLLNHIILKLPFDKIKIIYNSLCNLNFKNYLILCLNINEFQYLEKFKVKPLTSEIPGYDTIYFDHEFYLKLYPCYVNIHKNKNDSYAHFIRHGYLEKLICNEVIFELTKICQEYMLNQSMIIFNKKISPDNQCLLYNSTQFNYYNSDKPIIYILTRTSNREYLFKECCDSINKQSFVNVRHIVTYDNNQTYQYVKKYNHLYKMIDLTLYKSKLHPNQYIDHLYTAIHENEPGWIIVLDDDDKFMNEHALYHIEKLLTNMENLIIWMLYRPDKYIYPKNKKNPIVGEIGSCCYCYHTSKIKKGIWEGSGIGDFQFFKQLFDNTNKHIYIDYPLTGVNYNEKISGWTAM